jgi:hypothetical protein
MILSLYRGRNISRASLGLLLVFFLLLLAGCFSLVSRLLSTH